MSVLDRNTVVLSAYKLTITFPGAPGIWKPAKSGEALSIHARGSMAKSKSKQDKGSPWRTPRVTQ